MSREMGRNDLEKNRATAEKIAERGNEISEQAEQISSILDSINLDGLDSEDISVVDSTRGVYRSDFEGAVTSEVTEQTSDVTNEMNTSIEGLTQDQERINDASSKFQEMAGVSEIGSDNAESAGAQMEQSSSEYEQLIEGNREAIEEADRNAEECARRIDIF